MFNISKLLLTKKNLLLLCLLLVYPTSIAAVALKQSRNKPKSEYSYRHGKGILDKDGNFLTEKELEEMLSTQTYAIERELITLCKNAIEPEGKPIVLFLGPTGSGKSSLISFLQGCDAEYNYKHNTATIIQYSIPKELEIAQVGHQYFESETKGSHIYMQNNDTSTFSFCDNQGFLGSAIGRSIPALYIALYDPYFVIQANKVHGIVLVLTNATLGAQRGLLLDDIITCVCNHFFQVKPQELKKSFLVAVMKTSSDHEQGQFLGLLTNTIQGIYKEFYSATNPDEMAKKRKLFFDLLLESPVDQKDIEDIDKFIIDSNMIVFPNNCGFPIASSALDIDNEENIKAIEQKSKEELRSDNRNFLLAKMAGFQGIRANAFSKRDAGFLKENVHKIATHLDDTLLAEGRKKYYRYQVLKSATDDKLNKGIIQTIEADRAYLAAKISVYNELKSVFFETYKKNNFYNSYKSPKDTAATSASLIADPFGFFVRRIDYLYNGYLVKIFEYKGEEFISEIRCVCTNGSFSITVSNNEKLKKGFCYKKNDNSGLILVSKNGKGVALSKITIKYTTAYGESADVSVNLLVLKKEHSRFKGTEQEKTIAAIEKEIAALGKIITQPFDKKELTQLEKEVHQFIAKLLSPKLIEEGKEMLCSFPLETIAMLKHCSKPLFTYEQYFYIEKVTDCIMHWDVMFDENTKQACHDNDEEKTSMVYSTSIAAEALKQSRHKPNRSQRQSTYRYKHGKGIFNKDDSLLTEEELKKTLNTQTCAIERELITLCKNAIEPEGKPIVFVLGPTGSDKSSLISFLQGCDSEYNSDEDQAEVIEDSIPAGLEIAEVGHKYGESKTKGSHIYMQNNKASTFSFCDSEGFLGTAMGRSIPALYIALYDPYFVIQANKVHGIVLVFDENTIGRRGIVLNETIKCVCNHFFQLKPCDLKKSFLLAVMKTDTYRVQRRFLAKLKKHIQGINKKNYSVANPDEMTKKRKLFFDLLLESPVHKKDVEDRSKFIIDKSMIVFPNNCGFPISSSALDIGNKEKREIVKQKSDQELRSDNRDFLLARMAKFTGIPASAFSKRDAGLLKAQVHKIAKHLDDTLLAEGRKKYYRYQVLKTEKDDKLNQEIIQTIEADRAYLAAKISAYNELKSIFFETYKSLNFYNSYKSPKDTAATGVSLMADPFGFFARRIDYLYNGYLVKIFEYKGQELISEIVCLCTNGSFSITVSNNEKLRKGFRYKKNDNSGLILVSKNGKGIVLSKITIKYTTAYGESADVSVNLLVLKKEHSKLKGAEKEKIVAIEKEIAALGKIIIGPFDKQELVKLEQEVNQLTTTLRASKLQEEGKETLCSSPLYTIEMLKHCSKHLFISEKDFYIEKVTDCIMHWDVMFDDNAKQVYHDNDEEKTSI